MKDGRWNLTYDSNVIISVNNKHGKSTANDTRMIIIKLMHNKRAFPFNPKDNHEKKLVPAKCNVRLNIFRPLAVDNFDSISLNSVV